MLKSWEFRTDDRLDLVRWIHGLNHDPFKVSITLYYC